MSGICCVGYSIETPDTPENISLFGPQSMIIKHADHCFNKYQMKWVLLFFSTVKPFAEISSMNPNGILCLKIHELY